MAALNAPPTRGTIRNFGSCGRWGIIGSDGVLRGVGVSSQAEGSHMAVIVLRFPRREVARTSPLTLEDSWYGAVVKMGTRSLNPGGTSRVNLENLPRFSVPVSVFTSGKWG